MYRAQLLVFPALLSFAAEPARAAGLACGWYAITACKPTIDEAVEYARRTGSGTVINTSSPAYPNFQNGFFCVVSGPLDRNTALSTAGYWRSTGVSPNAYAKSAC